MPEASEKELQILESIYANPTQVRQRDLAKIVGLSLGMTNAILKRLVQKGLLTIRKVNNRNIRYAVSPKGAEAISRKSYRYFKRTIKNVVYYRRAIEQLVLQIKQVGFDGLVLTGTSDLDFIVEHACGRYGIGYVRDEGRDYSRLFTLYSETYIPDGETKKEHNHGDVAFLQDVLRSQ